MGAYASGGCAMKLLVYSDLHLDMFPWDWKPSTQQMQGIDAVVLAGDIAEGTRGLVWARDTFPDTAIVYIDGNHEFYGQHWDKHGDIMRQRAREREIHYLESEAVTIAGVRILGCTLWTDYALNGGDDRLQFMSHARNAMNDYKLIRITRSPLYGHNRHRLFPAMAASRHEASRRWLAQELGVGTEEGGKERSKEDGGAQGHDRNASCHPPTVVVTHHAPHPKSIPEGFWDHWIAPCYASDLTDLMGPAKLWIHGHIHDSVDYEVRGTRILSNPRGYQSSLYTGGSVENSFFKEFFVVNVDGAVEVGVGGSP